MLTLQAFNQSTMKESQPGSDLSFYHLINLHMTAAMIFTIEGSK